MVEYFDVIRVVEVEMLEVDVWLDCFKLVVEVELL